MTSRARIAAIWLLLLAIYLPALGHGFIKDDFVWITEARRQSPLSALTETAGFYRPVVSLSFELDHAVHDLESRGYAFTNLVLLLSIVFVIRGLARGLGLSANAADLCAGIWALNFHGINMALLWTSGRTSLLAVLFAALAATAFLKGRRLLTAGCLLLALGSKEEAVAVPFVLIAWQIALNGLPDNRAAPLSGRLLRLGRSAGYLLAPVVVYAVLRTFAGGMLPWNAPSYYRMSTDPWLLGRNVLEYADRGATFAAAVVIVLAALMKTVPDRNQIRHPTLICGGIWFAGCYAITVWLPVRSSLYACLPSMGAALAAGVLADAMFARRPDRAPAAALAAVFALVIVLVPVYRARNQSWRDLAMLSSSVLTDLRQVSRDVAPGTKLLILDDRSERANLDSAFGTLFQTAADLFAVNRPIVQVVPPPADAIPPFVFPPDEAQVRLHAAGVTSCRHMRGHRNPTAGDPKGSPYVLPTTSYLLRPTYV